MAGLRLALAQTNLLVGGFPANVTRVVDTTREALTLGADIVAFPELTLCGYPPEDLVLRSSFVDASIAALEQLLEQLSTIDAPELVVVVGYLDRSSSSRPQNMLCAIRDGKVIGRYAKRCLPNYGVFDEERYFEPGSTDLVIDVLGRQVGLVICEDIWYANGPVLSTVQAGARLVIAINGSPYEINKDDHRLKLCRDRVQESGAALAYVNAVGGQDELVFDGDSIVLDASGAMLARSSQFVEELLVVDLANDPIDEPPRLDNVAEVWGALALGTRDYVRKNGFTSVVLGLSGGIDSAVVATLAVDALGADAVHTIALPSDLSSEHSLTDAAELAARQGIHHEVIPIAPIVDDFVKAVPVEGVALENLQARVRGVILMAQSNQHGHLVLTTGNKSELATGFSTLYGDAAGGFGPIKDVLKTMVWDLARWRNSLARERGETEPIPQDSIDKPPSAELAPGQLDSDRLPPYDVLDPILEGYIEHDLGRAALIAAGHEAAVVDRVIRLVDLAEYKRRQYPPGPKVSSKAFGRDRRLPITNAWREG